MAKQLKHKANKKDEYEAELLKAIKKHKFKRLDHCFNGSVSFSGSTAYNYGLEKLESIKEALQENRNQAITFMIDNWVKSDNATLQVAAMRLLCEPDDHRRLNQQYIESKNETTNTIVWKEEKRYDSEQEANKGD